MNWPKMYYGHCPQMMDPNDFSEHAIIRSVCPVSLSCILYLVLMNSFECEVDFVLSTLRFWNYISTAISYKTVQCCFSSYSILS